MRTGTSSCPIRSTSSATEARAAATSEPVHPRLARLPCRALPGGLTVIEARSLRSRLLGLMGIDRLPADVGLELRTGSVHTFGVRLDLDLVWRDRTGQVIRIDRAVGRRRIRACHGARWVIEVPAGRADAFLAALEAGHDAGASKL